MAFCLLSLDWRIAFAFSFRRRKLEPGNGIWEIWVTLFWHLTRGALWEACRVWSALHRRTFPAFILLLLLLIHFCVRGVFLFFSNGKAPNRHIGRDSRLVGGD